MRYIYLVWISIVALMRKILFFYVQNMARKYFLREIKRQLIRNIPCTLAKLSRFPILKLITNTIAVIKYALRYCLSYSVDSGEALMPKDAPYYAIPRDNNMMTSSNGNILRVTGPLCGEFTGRRWIPLTKASDAELWCFLWSPPEKKNGWVNNRNAGDMRRHRAHYDVTVMKSRLYSWHTSCSSLSFLVMNVNTYLSNYSAHLLK